MIALIVCSIFVFPFLYILGALIKVQEVFAIGAVMAVIALAFLWGVYALFKRFKERKMLSAGITFLLAIPFTLVVNITLSKMVGEPAIDIFDVMSGFVLLIVAAAFIFGDYAKRNGHLR